MALKNKPILDIFLDSTHNVNRVSSNQTPIDESKINYDNYKKENLPTLRPIGAYWGGNKLHNAIDFQVGGTKIFTDRNIADTKRISDFLKSSKGKLWILREEGLQLMNPKVESLIPNILPTRIFNPIKFLSNIPGKSIGLHIERHGIIGDGNYSNIATIKNNSETYKTTNRLLQLYSELKLDNFLDSSSSVLLDKVNSNKNVSKLLGKVTNVVNKAKEIYNKFTNVKFLNIPIGDFLNSNDNFNKRKLKTLSGINGPNSIYGVGKTDIFSYQSGNKVDRIYTNNEGQESVYGKYSSTNKYDSNKSILEELTKANYNSSTDVNGSGKGLQPGNSSFGGNNINISDLEGSYNTYQSINTFKNQGKWTNWESDKYKMNHVDEFKNVYSAYTTDATRPELNFDANENYNKNWNYFKRLGIPEIGKGMYDKIYGDSLNGIPARNDLQDFVKLKIGGIQFRCTIDGVNRGFTANWSSVKYLGRPDDVYVYEGMSQNISFSFIVAAHSKNEMEGIYAKINQLVQFASPTLNEYGLMTGQIVDLKIGMWFSESVGKGLPVKINNISVNVEAEHTWDIIEELPMMFKVDMDCDVIGNKMPSNSTIYFGNSSSNITDQSNISDDNVTTVPEVETPPTDYGTVAEMVKKTPTMFKKN